MLRVALRHAELAEHVRARAACAADDAPAQDRGEDGDDGDRKREAAELAYNGAKVLHPRTLAPLIEKGIPFEEETCMTSQDPALLARSPMGKVPFLRIEEKNWNVPESSIIIEYLAQHYPGRTALLSMIPLNLLLTVWVWIGRLVFGVFGWFGLVLAPVALDLGPGLREEARPGLDASEREIAQAVAQMLSRVGIDTKVVAMPSAAS